MNVVRYIISVGLQEIAGNHTSRNISKEDDSENPHNDVRYPSGKER